MFRGALKVLAVLLVFATMVGGAPSAGAAKTISTADYANQFCQAGGPFRTAIALASNALNVNSTELTTVRTALVGFADDARSATETFRSALAKLGAVKSPAVRALNGKTIAKLKSIANMLAKTKVDASELVVTDQNAFGIGLVIVQKDIEKVSTGYQSVAKIPYPKALERAVAKDPECQQVQGTTQTTIAP